MTLRDMANAELRGHFKEAVLAWIDPTADPTGGVEQVREKQHPQSDTRQILPHSTHCSPMFFITQTMCNDCEVPRIPCISRRVDRTSQHSFVAPTSADPLLDLWPERRYFDARRRRKRAFPLLSTTYLCRRFQCLVALG